MIINHGQVVIKRLGKFYQWPFLLGPLVLEQINGCLLLTYLGRYFSDIIIFQSLTSDNITNISQKITEHLFLMLYF